MPYLSEGGLEFSWTFTRIFWNTSLQGHMRHRHICSYNHLWWRHLQMPHCLGLPYWNRQLVLIWYLQQPDARVTSVESQHRSDPRYTWSDKNRPQIWKYPCHEKKRKKSSLGLKILKILKIWGHMKLVKIGQNWSIVYASASESHEAGS